MTVLVDNEPGVLARVIGLFSGRGYNIESLTVAETDTQAACRASPSSPRGTPMVIEQIKPQLERLVPVHKVADLTVEAAFERELALVKVSRHRASNRVEALAPRRHLPRARGRRHDRAASSSRSPARRRSSTHSST